MAKYIIGIDESGRGPLAGPITIAAVATKANSKFKIQDSKFLRKIRDSKHLTEKRREEWFRALCQNKKFYCQVVSIGNRVIDQKGISKSVNFGIKRVLAKLVTRNLLLATPHPQTLILLDGSLYAPRNFQQKTIIKGDEKEPLIAAASIIAKVYRDQLMRRYHKKFPQYQFAKHKGYGTKLHCRLLKKYGPSSIHRLSFLDRILPKT